MKEASTKDHRLHDSMAYEMFRTGKPMETESVGRLLVPRGWEESGMGTWFLFGVMKWSKVDCGIGCIGMNMLKYIGVCLEMGGYMLCESSQLKLLKVQAYYKYLEFIKQ